MSAHELEPEDITAGAEDITLDDPEAEEDLVTDEIEEDIPKVPMGDKIVEIDIPTGFEFIQLLLFMKAAHSTLPFEFCNRGMLMERMNGERTIYTKAFIPQKNLFGFTFNEAECNQPVTQEEIDAAIAAKKPIPESRHVINPDFNVFMTNNKIIPKGSYFRFFQDQNPSYIFCESYGTTKSTIDSLGACRVKDTYDPQSSFLPPRNPNAIPNRVIPLASFCEACKQIIKCQVNSRFIVYPNGFKIMGHNLLHTIDRTNKWGDCSDTITRKETTKTSSGRVVIRTIVENVRKFETKVDLKTIRVLKGILSMKSAFLRVFSEMDGLINFEMPVPNLTDLEVTILEPRLAGMP
jgi:hypothetical protein